MYEREEGLFTRHGATRLLCILTVITGALVIGWGLFLLISLLLGSSIALSAMLSYPSWTLVVIFFLAWGPSSLLWLWRRCDRCRRRIFAEGRRSPFFPGVLRQPQSRTWLEKWLYGSFEPERDYRARTFLGSYRIAAILQMALTGNVRCQWCGHMDGSKPDYIVTKP